MERRFFDALLASADDGRGRRQAGLLPVSFAVHSAAVAALVLVPILAPGPMPPPAVDGSILTVPALLVPKPPPPRGRPPRATLAPPRQSVDAPGTMVAPAYVPPASWLDLAVDEGAGGLEAGLPECEGCVPWGVDDGLPGVGPSDPPAVPPKPVVRAGGDIQPPVKLHGVLPEYPHLALQTGLEGLVIIECQVDTDGRVADARVLRGHPLLNDAALAAVRQWRYRPTLLNGSPVSVILTVTVRFNLRR